MILRRQGNKSKIAFLIQRFFPSHDVYIDLFFGSGGMFFNKSKVSYNFVNDNDLEVFNLFQVIMNQKDEFIDLFYKMPVHDELFQYWKKNHETDSLKRAIRFIFLSNFSLFGSKDSLRFNCSNGKQIVLNKIDFTFRYLKNVTFFNSDFRDVFKKMGVSELKKIKQNGFVYADPPYVDTISKNYIKFSKKDVLDLFDVLQNSGLKFAYSEFSNEFVLSEAKKRKLRVHFIQERQTIKNRNTEILITNY